MASLPTKSFMRRDKKGSAHKNRPLRRGKRSVAQRRRRKQLYSNPNPLENEVISTDCGTTQLLQFRANDPLVHLDANFTVPYIEHEIVEQIVSQTLPCHTLSQEIVEPIISQTLPCHTLKQSFPVESSSRKSKIINITKRILPKRSPIDLPYDAVCTERIDEPVPDFLPEKRQWIVKKKVLLSTADSWGVKRSDVAGKRFMTLGEANYLTSNNLYKTRFTYSSSQRKPKPQLGQSVKNSGRNLLIRPAVSNVSNHAVLGGELIPPEKIKVEDEFVVVKDEFHESPEAVISSLNQEKWNSSLSGSCFIPVTTMIARSPSTQWLLNSCTSAVTTETVTTFASTSNKTVCTSTSALSNACLSSTSTTPMLISSSCAQPSTPCNRYVTSLPINPALNGPMIIVPQGPAAKSNSDLIFNSLLHTQSNQSHSMVTNFPYVANNLNKSSVPTRISDPSSNINSSLPIQKLVLNATINSTLCDTNLSSTLGLAGKPLPLNGENVLTLFDKDSNFLPNKNNSTLSDIDTALSHTKNTTLSDTKGTTLSYKKGPMSGTKGTTLSDTKGTTLSDTKGTTLSDKNSTSLSYRIGTTLGDKKSITTSDRNSATLADRIITYEPDRNATALLDIIISNVPKQNTTMLSNRNATVSSVDEPSTALSLNNSARKQDSLTIAMPSDTSSFASETVQNDKGAKNNVGSGGSTQQVLKEVADKLSKILPDTSFVKYLTDPDFYFFIGLLPLIQMLSLKQKVHARIIIKGILYDLAYPATSTSLVTSN